SNVDVEILVDNFITIKGDEKLLEQAIINLIKNSLEALHEVENPKIKIEAKIIEAHLQLSIEDNGMGIETDKIDDIFVPFYTSKEQGSGIGLSLVKQIVNIHKGHISVSSEKGIGTTFQIKL
ncbi:MAG: hypothetical protein C0597_05500, partial [Marinilabiliales bacterium]